MPTTPQQRLRSTNNSSRQSPLRYLTLLLQIIAVLLLTTTIDLFHLHHSIHPAAITDNNDSHNSPGGSALRHKLDLAHFILQKSNNSQQNDKAKEEAAKEHGWKGNAAENFVRPAVQDDEKEREIKPIIKKKEKADDKSYLDNLKSWSKLQQTLLQNNMLPTPIPRTQTSRGFSGLLPSQTTPPAALTGALRGTIHCPNTDPQINELLSSMMAFWNEPRGTRDDLAEYYYIDQNNGNQQQQHPFIPKPLDTFDLRHTTIMDVVRTKRRRYLTFEPDTGGWNNLRISFENVLILAAVSGRTLVLPPEQVMYLLDAKKGDKRHGYRQYTDYFETAFV